MVIDPVSTQEGDSEGVEDGSREQSMSTSLAGATGGACYLAATCTFRCYGHYYWNGVGKHITGKSDDH